MTQATDPITDADEVLPIRQDAPLYPPAYADTWLELLGGPDRGRQAVLRRAADALPALSDLFTAVRPDEFRPYAGDPGALAAYALYFFPQNYVRTRMILREAFAIERIRGRALRMLDLGCGIGAATVAAIDHVADLADRLETHALDADTDALRALKQFRSRMPEGRATGSLNLLRGDVFRPGTWPEGAFDLAVCSFALNECVGTRTEADVAGWFESLMARLAPGGVAVVIEPVSAATTGRLEALRDAVALRAEWSIVAPCLHRGPCPMRAEKAGWCHDVRTWRIPEATAWINRKTQRSVHDLKHSFLCVAREPAPGGAAGADRARLVSPMQKRKGVVRCWGCAADGGLHRYEFQVRELAPGGKDCLLALERGDRFTVGDIRPIDDGRILRARPLFDVPAE